MSAETTPLTGPDLSAGIGENDVRDDVPLLGHAHGEPIVLVRSAGQLHAVAAACTHYGGPLAEGLVADGAIHCPLHHACFDLRTGRAKAPALTDLACFDVEVKDGLVRIGAKRAPAPRGKPAKQPSSVVLVGAGGAAAACAEALRSGGYDGPITMLGEEPPIDRPNVSKDYLAGTAQEEWMPLRPLDFYREAKIDFVAERVASLDARERTVTTASGRRHEYGALLLATGAEPFVLPIDGARLPHVHAVRTLADAQAIIAAIAPPSGARRAVVIGASFIGLEAAASLRARGLDVTVVGMETVPLERVLGKDLGQWVRSLHESHGVTFHLGHKPASIDATHVTLDDGTRLAAELVIMGVGVRPRVALAEAAGLKVEQGVLVDARLRTSADDVYAAGDIARYPYGGGTVRIEHWALAERQGQHVARAMLGSDAPFVDVPFFWSAHYDVTIRYVGHSEKPTAVRVDGDLARRDATVTFEEDGRVAAVATVGRDYAALEAAQLLTSQRGLGARGQ